MSSSLLDQFKEIRERKDKAWERYEVALENKDLNVNQLYVEFRELEGELRGFALACQSILLTPTFIDDYDVRRDIEAVVELATKEGVL